MSVAINDETFGARCWVLHYGTAMGIKESKLEFSSADQPAQVSTGHNALTWTLAAGLLVAGAAATAMSLLLPSGENLQLPRVLSAVVGTVLIAISGATASYALTRAATVTDVEQRYTGVLERIARSLAHVHANLQHATSQRRSGAYAHEETYQEVVLAGASSVLAEFDSVTRMTGSIRGAFRQSKADLDEVIAVFGEGGAVAETIFAARIGGTAVSAEPVTVHCPTCQSKVSAHLAMRPGWSAAATCTHCGTRISVHRKGDLSVYTSGPKKIGEPAATDSVRKRENPTLDGAEAKEGHDGGGRIDITCPRCGSTFEIKFRADQVKDASVSRVCTGCACRYTVNVYSGAIEKWSEGVVARGVVIGRRSAHAVVECPVDQFGLVASYATRDGDWHAFCVSHQEVVATSRADIRTWMEANDPGFLAQRLIHEAAGGAKILSDL